MIENMTINKIIISALAILLVGFPFLASASVGVGVNLGKINIDEPLKPGGLYTFPIIGVINTGDEAGDYAFEVTYHQDQPELRPDGEWFSFSPSAFHLEAGESQNVEIKLTLPVKMKPGDYFAYLEAHPVIISGPGTTIGVAAATKTYFTVITANLWQAMVYKASSLFILYAPWTYVVLAILIGAILIWLFRRFFSFNIRISKKE